MDEKQRVCAILESKLVDCADCCGRMDAFCESFADLIQILLKKDVISVDEVLQILPKAR